MKKARKTTLEERICIVKTVLTIPELWGNGLEYVVPISRSEIGWNGMKMGSAGLEDRRGRRIGSSQAALQKKNSGPISRAGT